MLHREAQSGLNRDRLWLVACVAGFVAYLAGSEAVRAFGALVLESSKSLLGGTPP